MTKEELQDRIDILNDEVHKIWEKSFDMPYSKGWEWYRNHPKLKELIDLEREYKLVQDYELNDFYKDKNGKLVGDLISLDEFIKCCQIGPLFRDSDGIGYYATETQESNISINPSDIISGKYRKDFTHVIWYNK